MIAKALSSELPRACAVTCKKTPCRDNIICRPSRSRSNAARRRVRPGSSGVMLETAKRERSSGSKPASRRRISQSATMVSMREACWSALFSTKNHRCLGAQRDNSVSISRLARLSASVTNTTRSARSSRARVAAWCSFTIPSTSGVSTKATPRTGPRTRVASQPASSPSTASSSG